MTTPLRWTRFAPTDCWRAESTAFPRHNDGARPAIHGQPRQYVVAMAHGGAFLAFFPLKGRTADHPVRCETLAAAQAACQAIEDKLTRRLAERAAATNQPNLLHEAPVPAPASAA